MDIESMMEKFMKAESAQMEKLQQQKQKYEWKRDAYRDVNKTFTKFEQDIFDNYGKPSNWALKNISNSDNSKANVVATGTASGNLSLDISQVATAGNLKTTMENGVNLKSTMQDLGFVDGGSFIVSSLGTDGTMDDGVEITYTSTDTVDDVLKRIGQKTGVTAIGLGNQISFTNKHTGKSDNGTSVDILGDSNGLFSKLGLTATDTSNGYYNFDSQPSGTFKQGQNAIYSVNGIQQENASNKMSVSGYNIELKQKTDSSVTISSSTDTEKTIEQVKGFVETYNNLIQDMNARVTEKRKVSYEPLTDAQKAEMTEVEIKKWEEAAKAGLVKGDSNINSTLSSMRSTISGLQNELSKLGITTSKTWSDNGKLEFDEEKLKKTLEDNPEAVTNVFLGTDSSDGLIKGLRTVAQNTVKNIELTSGKSTSVEKSYSLGITISNLDEKISDWKERLKTIEERYWKQFSTMETAIQKANSQSSIFAQ